MIISAAVSKSGPPPIPVGFPMDQTLAPITAPIPVRASSTDDPSALAPLRDRRPWSWRGGARHSR